MCEKGPSPGTVKCREVQLPGLGSSRAGQRAAVGASNCLLVTLFAWFLWRPGAISPSYVVIFHRLWLWGAGRGSAEHRLAEMAEIRIARSSLLRYSPLQISSAAISCQPAPTLAAEQTTTPPPSFIQNMYFKRSGLGLPKGINFVRTYLVPRLQDAG